MPTLRDTIEISQMAFRWDATTRVFRTDVLRIFEEEDKEEWQLSAGSWGQVVQGLWLYFQIESNYLQRVSPASDTGNDWIDLKNALIDPATDVDFYPIYSVDATVSYQVLSNNSGPTPVLETSRSLFKPAAVLNIRAESRIAAYPSWMKLTRHKP